MKTFKRIASTLLAVLLLASLLVIPASAEEYTITVQNSHHTFEAYQIFSGASYDAPTAILSGVEWGSGISDPVGLVAALKADAELTGLFADISADDPDSATKVATALEGKNAQIDAFARVVGKFLSTQTTGTGAKVGEDWKITGVPAGYYLLKDTTPAADGHAESKYIVHVAGNAVVAPKVDAPALAKTASRDGGMTFAKGVSSTFGDEVIFRLEGTLHDRLGDYGKYYLQFSDTMATGLTHVENSVKVYVRNGAVATDLVPADGYEVNVSGQVLTVTFDDIKTTIHSKTGRPADGNDVVVVEYKGKLNSSANVGKTLGNKNVATLTYSCNPNDHTGIVYKTEVENTPEASAYVYTYKMILHKVDGATDANLQGATFVLARPKALTIEYATVDTVTRQITGWVTEKAAATPLTTGTDGTIDVIGLASNITYELHETVAPNTYNPIEGSVNTRITATPKADGTLDTMSVSVVNAGATLEGIDPATSDITIKIPNTKGTTLPSTGGMGTTVLYVTGSVMMLCAAAVLLAKKRFARV